MPLSMTTAIGLKTAKTAIMDNNNWALSNAVIMGLNIETYYIKTAKNSYHGQRHLTIYEFQLPLSMTAVLRTSFVFNSVSKLI